MNFFVANEYRPASQGLIRTARWAAPAGALALFALAASGAQATVLTFDIDNTAPASVLAMDQAYGDRVSALVQDGATYGVGAEGLTPNVTVGYSGGPGASLTRWTTDYGDLVNVLENESDGDTLLRLDFVADEGFNVVLHGFDLGGWPNSDYTIAGLSVLSGATTLYSESNVPVRGATGAPRHSSFAFDGGLSGQSLSILIDLSGLGGNSDNIAIDNVRFGQVATTPGGVPEPATWAMMLLGLFGAGGVLRSRRATMRATLV